VSSPANALQEIYQQPINPIGTATMATIMAMLAAANITHGMD